MVTLAAKEKMSVAFPQDITAFLKRRAKRDHLSIPQTLTAIVASAMGDEEDEIDDPYFNKTIMARLRRSKAQAERGELVEHELIEA